MESLENYIPCRQAKFSDVGRPKASRQNRRRFGFTRPLFSKNPFSRRPGLRGVRVYPNPISGVTVSSGPGKPAIPPGSGRGTTTRYSWQMQETAVWDFSGNRFRYIKKNFRIYARLVREKPLPNSWVRRFESSLSVSFPYSARSAPF